MLTLETSRLRLRGWKQSDLDDIYEYAKDERVGPSAGWPAHPNKEMSQKILDSFIQDGDVYAIVLKDQDKVIGSIGLHNRTPDESLTHLKQAEIGYVLNPDYWGQGYMPEAVNAVIEHGFKNLGLDLIWCGYYDFNTNSKRVVEKSGFKYQFTKPKILTLLDNRVVDQLFYSFSKEDYLNIERQTILKVNPKWNIFD